ncbi:hypothetical protein [Psychroserpens sp.]|uniref:hypothetical protein n=1 Tax=Psychroserpens sp. TaxID=2020870 RepID=UPI00385AA96F
MKLKKIAFIVFRVIVVIILFGKISNWFLNYSDETNQILNTSMFTIIGFSYAFAGFIWKKKLTNFTFIICGLYLIAMNFMVDFNIKSIIGIICILIPLLIARFSQLDTDEAKWSENRRA